MMLFFQSKNVRHLAIYLLILLLFNSTSAESQSRFKVGATYNFKLAPKPEINHVFGTQQIDTRITRAFDVGLHLEYRFSNRQKLISGFRIGKYPLSYGASIPGHLYDGTYGYDINFQYKQLLDYWDIPILYEFTLQKRPEPNLFFHVGVDLKFNHPMFYRYRYILNNPDSLSEKSMVYESRLNSTFSGIHYSIQAGAAYYASLFRKNDLRLNITFNYSLSDMAAGEYAFFNGTKDLSWGHYKIRGHYIAFGATYIFGQPKK